MEVSLTPRQIAKKLLNGELPPRPLVLPIVFSLGAKVENMPLDTFLTNPTKIVSAARQLRSHLQADGVACYYDRYLEVEALGATLERASNDESPMVHWKHAAKSGELPQGLRSPEEAVQSGRVPVAAEVMRRLNALPNREHLLIASVTGPMALAKRLAGMPAQEKTSTETPPMEVLEFAASVTTQMATTFLEAGADTIFLHEAIPLPMKEERCEEWANLLAPAINVTRFYEALPVLLLAKSNVFPEDWAAIFRHPWECVVCAPASAALTGATAGVNAAQETLRGIALPMEVFQPGVANSQEIIANCQRAVAQSHPAIITTAEEVPCTADMKQLKKVFEEIARGA
jgi:uroporphyrinogen-III decarboxylase